MLTVISDEGLDKDGTSLLQVPSYVTKLPNGSERGVSLAIDLGGTNMRVCLVKLLGNSELSVIQSKAVIPPEVMTATTYSTLFDFIAQHVEVFMRENMASLLNAWAAVSDEGRQHVRSKYFHSIGFTFSFTFNQHALNRGTLIYWTKAFNIEDAVGRDPCAMLQEALDGRDLPLTVTALVNDTVGSLAARAYYAPTRFGPLLGAIFGTGTNGAYMERVCNIRKLHSDQAFADAPPDQLMAVNTEWGNFDRELSVLPRTCFDDELDQGSINPRDQCYEKRISGLYLGELLRLTLLSGVRAGVLPWATAPDAPLLTAYGLDSSLLTGIIQDQSPGLDRDGIYRITGSPVPDEEQTAAVRIIAEALCLRACRLSSIAVAGVVLQSGRLAQKDKVPEGPATWAGTVSSTWILGPVLHLLRQWLVTAWLRLLHGSTLQKESEEGSAELPHQDVVPMDETIDVGVDGSLFEFLPGFEDKLRIALREMAQIGPQVERKIRMGLAKDGSGVGAALIALLSREDAIQ